MEQKLKEGEEQRNNLAMSRRKFEAKVEEEKNKYKAKLEEYEELEEGKKNGF